MKNDRLKAAIAVFFMVLALVGCTDAEEISASISDSADNFEVQRRITVINTRTDTVIWQLTGVFSMQHSGGGFDIIVKLTDDEYEKHYFILNDWTTYLVEDVTSEHLPSDYYQRELFPEVSR